MNSTAKLLCILLYWITVRVRSTTLLDDYNNTFVYIHVFPNVTSHLAMTNQLWQGWLWQPISQPQEGLGLCSTHQSSGKHLMSNTLLGKCFLLTCFNGKRILANLAMRALTLTSGRLHDINMTNSSFINLMAPNFKFSNSTITLYAHIHLSY